jgi:diacylglycerol O-acyltransferase-1
VAYVIELAAVQHAKGFLGRKKRGEGDENKQLGERQQQAYDSAWRAIAVAHGLNASLCLLVTSTAVFYFVHHPLLGTICQVHAIIVWLKICSYAFTNRDLRQ